MKKNTQSLKVIIKKIFNLCAKINIVDNKIALEYKKQKIRCPVHLSLGQEALAAAIGCIIKKKDFVFSGHRSHAHYLVKNGSINKMISELYGKKNGCSNGLGGSMHLVDENVNFMGSTAIVANSIPVGVGYALGNKIKNSNSRTYIFFGDGAVEEGVFYESINFAILKKLNIVFVCENNEFSVYSHINLRQPKNRKIYKFCEALGIKSYKITSSDPVSIYEKANKIINKNKNEPIFLEIDTFRNVEHCGPNNDDHLNYRSKNKIIYWERNNVMSLFAKKNYTKYLSFKNQMLIKKE